MGGDGGVIASNRRYMRGAGTADHTADYNNDGNNNKADGNNPQEIMTTCAITRTKFTSDSVIVACRFGKLYLREAAIQELLENKQRRKNNTNNNMQDKKILLSASSSPLAHVRKLSELYDVRFQYPESSSTTKDSSKSSNSTTESTATTITPICPMTSKLLVGTKIPAILLVPGNSDQPNVISESSWKQLTEEQWQEEYGPIEKRIRLAPPTTMLVELKEEYEQEVAAAAAAAAAATVDKKKKNKKNKKKRHNNDDNNDNNNNTNATDNINNNGSTIDRSNKKIKHNNNNNVASAIQSNKVLSSLFCSSDKTKDLSDKDHKDNLFART